MHTQAFDETPFDCLKLFMLFADLLNGLIYHIGNVTSTETNVIGLIAIIIPITFFLAAATAFMLIALRTWWRKLDTDEKIKLICTELSYLIGLLFYFIGDNFQQVKEIQDNMFLSNINNTLQQSNAFIQINAIQAPFLLLGIIYFRAIPHIINRIWNNDDINKKIKSKDSIFVGILNIVVVTTEFDAWFTLLQTLEDCSTEQCITLVWILCLVMILLYTVAMSMSGIRGWWAHGEEKELDITDLVNGILIVFFLTVAFAFYLISDNRQPLDCYASPYSINFVRLVFVIISSFVYLVFSFYGGIHLCIINVQ